LVILVKPKVGNSKGEVFIATGYGLEGVVTDAVARRVIEKDMIPYFKNEDYYGGINAALNRLMPIISGEISVNNSDVEVSIIPSLVVLALIGLFIYAMFKGGNGNTQNYGGGRGGRRMSTADAIILSSILSSAGRNRGGSYSGGGFGGGGFGGFGGGSFGGGGAGGSW
jgi:uncharacterized protein